MRSFLGCLFTALVLSQGSAEASYSFQFEQANYNVLPGQTVDVRVFILQSAGDTSLSDGLISAAVKIITDAPFPTQPATIQSAVDIILNDGPGAFDGGPIFNYQVFEPGYSGLVEATDYSSPAVTDGGTNAILLGTFRFTVGAVVGEVTHIRATQMLTGDFTFDAPMTFDINGLPLDELPNSIQDGLATITVINATAMVPEPSSFVLVCGLATFAAPLVRRRKRFA